jgi:hypothetical protein
MIFTLIIGFLVGVFYTHAEPFIASGLERAGLNIEADKLVLVSFALVLSVAALGLYIVGVSVFPALLCLGAAIGIIRQPLLVRITGNS